MVREDAMKIARDPASRKWTLTSGSRVLYTGYRAWDNPRLMRAAIEREQTVVRVFRKNA